MEQRFFVLAEIGKQLDYILQVSLGFNAFTDIIAAAFKPVSASGILNDLSLFHRFNKSVVNAECHTVAVGKLRENCLFLGSRRILTNRPYTAIAVAYDIMVG